MGDFWKIIFSPLYELSEYFMSTVYDTIGDFFILDFLPFEYYKNDKINLCTSINK